MRGSSQPDPGRCVGRTLGPGETWQMNRGERTLLLERTGGQVRFHALEAGEPEQELVLGMGGTVVVMTEALLPERPLVLELAHKVALAPGGRLKGYVNIPLGWKVWIRGRRGPARYLDTLPPDGLGLTFLGEGRRRYVHPLAARLLTRRPSQGDGGAVATLPLHLVCREPEWLDVQRLFLPLEGLGVRRLGRRFFTDPVRFVLAQGRARLQWRSLDSRGAGSAREVS